MHYYFNINTYSRVVPFTYVYFVYYCAHRRDALPPWTYLLHLYYYSIKTHGLLRAKVTDKDELRVAPSLTTSYKKMRGLNKSVTVWCVYGMMDIH